MKISKNVKIINLILLCVVAVSAIACSFFFNTQIAHAGDVYAENGLYDVPITKDIAMYPHYFGDNVAVEKHGDTYYMTFNVLKSSSFGNLKLKIDDTFVKSEVDGEITRYTYKLTKDQLYQQLDFTVCVVKMGNVEVPFSITLQNDKAEMVEVFKDDVSEGKPPILMYVLPPVIIVVLIIIITVTVVLVKKKKKNKSKNNKYEIEENKEN